MKHFKFLISLLLVGLFITSCQRDDELIAPNETLQGSNQVELRSYNQIDCGFAENFCEREPKNPPVVALVSGGDGGIKVSVKNSQYRIYPFEIFDGSTGVIVNDGSQSYIGHKSENSYLLSKTKGINLPIQLGIFLELNYQDNFDISNVSTKIEENIGLSNVGTTESPEYVLTDDIIGTDITWVKECDYILVSKVENFVSVFFDASTDQPHIEGFIEDAFNSCPPAYPDYQADIPNRCLNYCIDPRCVVDYLLDINAGLSDYQKRVLVSRYLEETLGLTDDEQNWLTLNDQSDLVYEIFNGLLTNQNLGRCDKEDCGMAGGYHELIKQEMAGETLTAEDTEGLLEFFSVMSCDDPVIFSCFREAQQNPDGDVATFLNEVIAMTQSESNFLVDGCDDLAPYTGRWEWLATFNPVSVQEVSDKLEELGEEYWIQTIDNATNVNWWWEASPTVNMDFFGITITTLPNKPFPPFDQFTAEEFFNYLQDNFTTSTFLGDGNDCHSVILPPSGGEFVPYSGAELFNWTGQTPITSTFEINMFDDGSDMCTDFNDGENWTFSTLNAPGWLEGDSYDGFHPVSGNRQFGIIDNGDGTYTFYTSGVDRLTGWWHVLGGAGTSVAFDKAEELWKCFLDQIKTFVEGLGGEVSLDYDCTNVRPDLDSLKEILKQGCGGNPESLDEFPCHQSSECP